MHPLRNSLSILSLILSSVCLSAQSSGVVYTTNQNGCTVPGNLYSRDCDVYLAGGPGPTQPCSAAGLANGHYYFQVTDPSGSQLFSLDTIANREVEVCGGVITSHITGTHCIRNGPCGSKVVQLIPFAPTPSPGGEYKVWLTPVSRYDLGGAGFYGFLSQYSKTDNFKVLCGNPPCQSVITGYTFFDHSENGIWNPGVDPQELPIAGWRIEILRCGVLDDVTYTDQDGRYVFIRDRDTTWTIREIAPGGFIGDGIPGAVWLATTPRSATVTTCTETVHGPDFGVVSFEVKPGVGRTKGFWSNQNGRALLAARDPQWRQSLTARNGNPICLRRPVSTTNPALSLFIPMPLPATFNQAYNDLARWLTEASRGHAGHILSTQVAAAILNRDFGFMQFTTYVDAHRDGVLVSFEDLVAGAASMLLCQPDAGLTGPHDPARELREHMLECLNEFGGINNSGDLSEPQVVYGTTRTAKTFSSPYNL